ncbi:MAG: hypothetical protein LBG07_02425, partial [Treponema sp.]|nr:hypothetical protein [Treponema sp.]
APAQAEENAAQGILTAFMIRCLRETSPWLRFVGIVGYIGAALLIVSGIVTMATGFGGITGFRYFPLVSGLAGFSYIPLGALAFFPARFTYRFGQKIRHYLSSGAEKDLEEALKNNRSLWKFSGILIIVYLSFIPVGIIAAVVMAVSGLF